MSNQHPFVAGELLLHHRYEQAGPITCGAAHGCITAVVEDVQCPECRQILAVPGQPDGIHDDSRDLPAVERASGRVRAYVSEFGDGLYDVCNGTPLYGRDLEALCRAAAAAAIDAAHLARQRAFSERTFGPGARTKGVVDHIRKELLEIEADPTDLGEWVDVVILALDGAWRAGHGPQEILDAIVAKQARNEARVWPDWRTADPDKAIEHDRATDGGVTQ